VSFTPCVYPFIPISISIIGIGSGTSRAKGFTLSFIYVTGIAVTYAALGLLASLTGNIFGAVSSHPVTNIAVGLIVVLFGLFMLDVFKLSLTNFINPPKLRGQGILAVFLLGLVSGLIMSPCTTPVLGAILSYLFTKQNILYGTTLLIVFAYGMGLLLILAGTFSSILAGFPKADKWSVYIKKLAALILIGAGLYFIFSGISRF